MHGAPTHVNPLPALRTIACADRWHEAWPQIAARLRAYTRERPASPPRPLSRPTPAPSSQCQGLPGPLRPPHHPPLPRPTRRQSTPPRRRTAKVEMTRFLDQAVVEARLRESASKKTSVVEVRLKCSRMHWAPTHVNPLLALRTIACADRWHEAGPPTAPDRRAPPRAEHSSRERPASRPKAAFETNATPVVALPVGGDDPFRWRV